MPCPPQPLRRPVSDLTRRVVLALALAWFAAGSTRVRAAVELRLRVPAAETWVLGDVIPLHWRFVNQSTQALGFMWEGCCRLNGQLAVTAGDRSLPTAPPGQALAHMFAKADRLEPRQPKEYETRVADWVALPGTGTYELRGTYRGVLPTQFPQLQRGLALWRDAASSPPVSVSVLAVDAYLAQRPDREQRRGLTLRLEGPPVLPVTAPARFRVALAHRGPAPRSLAWPDDVALWVVDPAGTRVAPAAVIAGDTETLTLAPGTTVEREFALPPGTYEGESPGAYRFFVDLAATPAGEPRVPAPPIPVSWQLGEAEVRELLAAAARGAGSGARNAPLKLLRVHLADVAPFLAALAHPAHPALAPSELALARRLDQAATLRPLGPKPGHVDLELDVPASGPPIWARPEVRATLARLDPLPSPDAQLRELLALRRHLGWEITVILRPHDDTRIGALLDLARACVDLAPELAGPLQIHAAGAILELAPGPGRPTAPLPTLRRRADGADWEWAADGTRFGPVPAGIPATPGLVRWEADPGDAWGTLARRLGSVPVAGRRFELRARDPAPSR